MERKSKVIKITAAALVCMTVTGLAGCSTKTGGSGTAGQSTGSLETEKKDIPLGRYAEYAIDIPALEAGETPISIIQNGEKQLELYTFKAGEGSNRYLYDKNMWIQQEKSYLDEIDQNLSMAHVIYGKDKNRYVFYEDENHHFHLVKFGEETVSQQLLEEEFDSKNERGFAKLNPDAVSVTEDGTLLLSNHENVLAYSQTGELLYTIDQTAGNSDWKNSFALSGNRYITVNETGFLKYKLPVEVGQKAEQIPFQNMDTDRYGVPIAIAEDGGFYIANSGGIHHMSSGGSMWETIVDGELNSLSMPSLSIGELFLDSDGGFFVTVYENFKLKLLHYQYDATLSAVLSKQLTVYGLNMENQDTIRQAASMFQIANPDVKVELIDGGVEAGGITKADVIRSLNTELLNGNGADVLVLDGLPAESYIEKGVLENLQDVITPLKDSGQLLPNIVDAFSKEDGTIYQMAGRVKLPVIYGEQKALASLSSLDSVKAYQSVSGNLPIKSRNIYENLLFQMTELYYPELVDEKTGELIPGKIQLLLETVKLIGEANGAKVSFDDSEEEGRGEMYNIEAKDVDGFLRSDYKSVDRGITSVAIDQVMGVFDMVLPIAVINKNNWSLQGFNNIYIPQQILGINHNSPNTDLAKEFLSFVLSEEVQNRDLSDGLPVNSRSADVWGVKNDRGAYSIGVSGEGYELYAEWPEVEEVDYLMGILKQAAVPVVMDDVLVEMIINESRGFFEGTMSAKEAAQAVENKAKLYFAE